MRPIVFNLPFSYQVWKVPHGCRNPRPVRFEAVTEVRVPRLSVEEGRELAPIAARVFGDFMFPVVEYRFFDGHGWYKPMAHDMKNVSPHFDPFTHPYAHHRLSFVSGVWEGWETRPEMDRNIREHYSRFLIIGRTAYVRTYEPRYMIGTYGLGHNHGGTSVHTEDSYNSNIPNHRYFRLDRRRECGRAAERIARERGDTQFIPMRMPEVRLRRPDLLSLDPMREHGTGDPFINRIENIIDGSDSSGEAGMLAVLHTIKDVVSHRGMDVDQGLESMATLLS